MQRLFATAPRWHYTAPDQQFVAGLRAVERLTLIAALEIQTQTLRWMRCLALAEHRLRHGTEQSLREAEHERTESVEARQAIAAIWQAFTDVCEQVGVDAIETMRAFGTPEAAAAGTVIGDIEPDPELSRAAKERMSLLINQAGC